MLKVLRVGLYERVSTEEQALRGFSIETQIANLEEYCEKNNLRIVDHYTDEGISGTKPPLKRPALNRLIEDVKAGKIDLIIFTKLDRWFRSVKEYFKVQEILDEHGVEWRAIHENYDTTTANGQMAITMFLAIAQNERDRTAERIKVVFAHKRKNKEACFSRAPLGYKKVKDENGIRRLVKDETTRPIIEEFWDIVLKYNNVNKAIRYIDDTYGIVKDPKTWNRITKNPFYCGMYDGIEDFCEPYVSKEDWLKVQELAYVRVRKTKNKRVYIFRGLIKCPNCGKNMSGNYCRRKYKTRSKEYYNYRCRDNQTMCRGVSNIAEMRLEKYLLANLDKHVNQFIAKAEIEKNKPKPKPKNDPAKYKEKLRRLNVMYMAGGKSDEEYTAELKELNALMAKAEAEKPAIEYNDVGKLRSLIESDFRAIYELMDKEEKQRFWFNLIKEIKFEGLEVKEIIFK